MPDHTLRAAASQNNSAYRDNYAHRTHDPYKGSDPYATNDPYADKDAHKNDRERIKRGPWALDFEIVRFFRENYNAGIDFEESPRAFFDEEHMLALRLKLLGRNFKVILFKFFFMALFSATALLLSGKALYTLGFFYLVAFLYFVAVPMGFVKYTRQYVADDSERGKLKKVHATYAKWLQPLEVIAMNSFTVVFVLVESVMLFQIQKLQEYMIIGAEKLHFKKALEYVSSLSVNDLQISILTTIAFYLFAYLTYWVFIYKFWSPKWEKVRVENEKAYRQNNQRTAKNLRDELTKEGGM